MSKNNKAAIFATLREINSLIDNCKYDEASRKLEIITSSEDYNVVEKHIDLLRRKINENRGKYDSNGKIDEIYEKYNIGGNYLLYYEDYYNAYQCYMAGLYLTSSLTFIFSAAEVLMHTKEYKKARELFYEYSKNGYRHLNSCYEYLIQCSNNGEEIKNLRKTKSDMAVLKIEIGEKNNERLNIKK